MEGSGKTMATFSAEAELVAAPAVLAAHKRAVGETKDKASDDGASQLSEATLVNGLPSLVEIFKTQQTHARVNTTDTGKPTKQKAGSSLKNMHNPLPATPPPLLTSDTLQRTPVRSR